VADREKYLRSQEKRRAQALEYDRKQRELRPEAIRERQAIYMRGWRARNLDRQKDYELRSRNGVTLEEYGFFFDAQGGVCAICEQSPAEGKFLSVDHCHDTKRIRGLLCRNCNLALGNLKDDPDLIMRAAMYMETRR
jgi:hypothetical protein